MWISGGRPVKQTGAANAKVWGEYTCHMLEEHTWEASVVGTE